MSGSNESSLVSPNWDYTIADATVTAVRGGKRFGFRDGPRGLLDSIEYDLKPESKTSRGSGVFPRAHTRQVFSPMCSLSMPLDTSRRFQKFCNGRHVDLIVTWQKVDSAPITDIIRTWLPKFGPIGGKVGDVSPRKVDGDALRIDEDVKGVLA